MCVDVAAVVFPVVVVVASFAVQNKTHPNDWHQAKNEANTIIHSIGWYKPAKGRYCCRILYYLYMYICVCVLSFLAYSRPFAYEHLCMFVPICICVLLLNDSLDKCYSSHITKKKIAGSTLAPCSFWAACCCCCWWCVVCVRAYLAQLMARPPF